MTFTLRCQKTCLDGSFEAWGVGFHYKYDAPSNSLSVFKPENAWGMLDISLPRKIEENPMLFVQHLEKVSQIKSLILSNNETVRLCETIVPDKLSAIAKSVSRLALSSFDARPEKLARFAKAMQRQYLLQSVEMNYINARDVKNAFFTASITTKKGNRTDASAASISLLLRELSEKIVRDLMTREFGSAHQGSADRLLVLSSRLSIISRILDENYTPEKSIKPAQSSDHKKEILS
jgi:hypothetical protein